MLGKDCSFSPFLAWARHFLLGETMKKVGLVILLVVTIFTLSSCSNREDTLLIVTTTSLDNSGLLEYILPHFEEEYDCSVSVVALGTGAALELGALGEADIILVHDYERELQFIEDGYGEKRKSIMYNDFIFVGPSKIESNNILDTLTYIKDNGTFYSRGDNSGTHSKELSLWEDNSFTVTSFGDWYKETGQGMGTTLTMASLSGYYTFTDRGTYLSMKEDLELVISYENTEELINMYGVIKISESLHERDPYLADQFYEWITKDETLDLIDSYIKYNEQLFYSVR